MRCVVVDALACIEQDVLPLHQVDRTLQLVCWNPSYCIHNTLPLFMQQQRSFSQGYCQIPLLFSFSLLYFRNYASKTTDACILSQKLFSLHVAVNSRLQGVGCSTVHTHFVRHSDWTGPGVHGWWSRINLAISTIQARSSDCWVYFTPKRTTYSIVAYLPLYLSA
jgi:hypothetical protein